MLYKKMANANTTKKKDGNPCRNSVKERLASTVAEQESALASVQKEINLLPSTSFVTAVAG